ncbi:hypothetical protein COCNU_04G010890 [Cocos nucifera]|uniref:Uncharacterized protein n=1 Tax=Cocos nucifera TaxID=13894 RepID=A0A8K0I6A1_COCNU|nr:hypothetical protein COCNU_04G010890 [Cocos nucifera]
MLPESKDGNELLFGPWIRATRISVASTPIPAPQSNSAGRQSDKSWSVPKKSPNRDQPMVDAKSVFSPLMNSTSMEKQDGQAIEVTNLMVFHAKEVRRS